MSCARKIYLDINPIDIYMYAAASFLIYHIQLAGGGVRAEGVGEKSDYPTPLTWNLDFHSPHMLRNWNLC